MKAGFARREIIPEASVPMAGFDARKQSSLGVLDTLYVSVLALDDGREPFLFCSFDLLGAERRLCELFYREMSRRLGLRPERIWVSATHTHSAPSTVFSNADRYDGAYVRAVADATVCAAAEALSRLETVNCFFKTAEAAGVASVRNRGAENAAFLMPVWALRFVRPDGEDCILCRIVCHPTVLDEKNRLFSRDLPGAAARAAGWDGKAVFLNGPCADISTRYTRRSSSPQELERLGGTLAQALDGTEWKPVQSSGALISANRLIKVARGAGITGEKREDLIAEFARKRDSIQDRQEKREYDACIAVLMRPTLGKETSRDIWISAVNLGGILLCAFPFEMPVLDGVAIEKKLSALVGKPAYVVCYTNGYDGYLPSGAPLSVNSNYEDIASRYEPGIRKEIVEAAAECVTEVMMHCH